MAEGGGLLNRYRVVKPYRGFEIPPAPPANIIKLLRYNRYFYSLAIRSPSQSPMWSLFDVARLRLLRPNDPWIARPIKWLG